MMLFSKPTTDSLLGHSYLFSVTKSREICGVTGLIVSWGNGSIRISFHPEKVNFPTISHLK